MNLSLKPRPAPLALAALTLLAASGAHADVLRLNFSTQVGFNGGPGFNQSYFLDEFGVGSPNGVAVTGYVDIDRAVLPQAGAPGQNIYADAIRAVQLTIGNKTLGFRDNPAVAGGQVEVNNSSGWDGLRVLTPALNGLAARPSNEAAPAGSEAYSYVFDWAPGSTGLGAYFGLSNLYLALSEYDMLSSADLTATGISQPLPSISQSRLNFELVMASSPTASFFAPSNARYYASSTSGFSIGGQVLEAGGPTGSVPEPATLALALAGLLALATRTASSR